MTDTTQDPAGWAGKHYAAPETVTAVTPGQAFRDSLIAGRIARGLPVDARAYRELPDEDRAGLETAGRAAVAAYIEANGCDPADVRAVITEAAAGEADSRAEITRLRVLLADTTSTALGWRDERDRLLSEVCRLTALTRDAETDLASSEHYADWAAQQ